MALKITGRNLFKHLPKYSYQFSSFSISPSSGDDPKKDDQEKTTKIKKEDHTDILICGGGMVGATLACSLGKCNALKGKRIVLLESAPEKKEFIPSDQYSNRTCALSPATVRLLESIGAWQEIKSMRYQSILRMQVWDSCSDSWITFNNKEMTDNLAYMVENDITHAGIMKALENMENRVEVRYNTKADHITLPGKDDREKRNSPYVKLKLSDQTVLNTKLLIGADGMNSAVRKAVGFKTISRDYGQSGVVATLLLGETSLNNTAWQRFLPTGPIAVLPISDNQSSLVWSTTKKMAEELKNLSNESFVEAVNDALWNERDKNEFTYKAMNALRPFFPQYSPEEAQQLPPTVINVAEGSRASFPLSLIHSRKYVTPRVALVGDAAHRIHPLAGQGVNLGFGDVKCLTDVLEQATKKGADPGSLTHLLQYETKRQQKNVPVTIVTDGLQRLYGTKFTPFVALRSLGLQLVQSCPPLKKKIIEEASL